MIAVHARNALTRLREPNALRRALIFGAAWGMALTIALTGLVITECGGVVCADEAMWLGGISTATGIVAIGPIAALGRA